MIKDLHSLGFKVGLWYAPFTAHAHLPLYQTLDSLINDYRLDMIKLDFLYQPYFAKGLKDDGIPHQILVDLFAYLHTNHPKVYTIACGSPFAPALGRVDAIRFSKDTTLPPPFPQFARHLLYTRRIAMLAKKYSLIPPDFNCIPDPDVRMISLDNEQTSNFWDTIQHTCLGVGDDLTRLSPTQIKKLNLWLQKNH